jgi:hypothetical protein
MRRETQKKKMYGLGFIRAIPRMWPLAIGSLSLRTGRCIQPNCPPCAADKLHTNYALYGRRGNRRFSMYVPERLAPEVRKAIRNGRQLRRLINEAGIRYLMALRAC